MLTRATLTAASVLLAVLVSASSAAKSGRLPANFKRCSQADPEMNGCLRDAVQAAIPELVKGVPSLGVFPIDPLEILEADIVATQGPVALNLNFKKLKFGGLNAVRVLNVSFDPKAYHMKLHLNVPDPLTLNGHYKVNGRVLVLPIQGDGLCRLALENITADVELLGKEKIKHGQKHMDIVKLNWTFETTRLSMRFENLFNGNKELGENMNRFLNENWPEILMELKPSIIDTFGNAFQVIANRIFQKVPFDNVFPTTME